MCINGTRFFKFKIVFCRHWLVTLERSEICSYGYFLWNRWFCHRLPGQLFQQNLLGMRFSFLFGSGSVWERAVLGYAKFAFYWVSHQFIFIHRQYASCQHILKTNFIRNHFWHFRHILQQVWHRQGILSVGFSRQKTHNWRFDIHCFDVVAACDQCFTVVQNNTI